MKKCKYGEYNEASRDSILEYALLLRDKSLKDLYADEIAKLPETYLNNKGKGSIGNLVELLHFNYQPNSKAAPDFEEASLELKTTPLKLIRGEYASKERLVLGMIDYFGITKETFQTSSFIKKNLSLLLMFYLYEKGKSIEQIFKIIKIWDIPEADLAIIRSDWEKIYTKISIGKAHELSGSDTFYLEAARKGAGGEKDKTAQPESEVKANRRAFAFKSSYVNHIIEEDKNLETSVNKEFIQGDISYEEYIQNRFKKFYGLTIGQLTQHFNLPYSSSKKDIAHAISKAILGVKQGKNIAEFEKANILMKTVTLNTNGVLPESMSFEQINFRKIITEKWLESDFYNNIVNRKFFFVVFRRNANQEIVLEKVFFWNMPIEMQRLAKLFWNDAKKKIQEGNMDDFWKSKDNKDFHVRTKARVAADTTTLHDGTEVKKLGYWINRATILKIVNSIE